MKVFLAVILIIFQANICFSNHIKISLYCKDYPLKPKEELSEWFIKVDTEKHYLEVNGKPIWFESELQKKENVLKIIKLQSFKQLNEFKKKDYALYKFKIGEDFILYDDGFNQFNKFPWLEISSNEIKFRKGSLNYVINRTLGKLDIFIGNRDTNSSYECTKWDGQKKF